MAERQIRLAEQYGLLIARLIQGILGDLRLTAAQRKLMPNVVRTHLMALETGEGDGPGIDGAAKRAS